MSFNINWPVFSPEFIAQAREQLTKALNKGEKPANIVDHIEVTELYMGKKPPDLEVLEIGELQPDRFRGMFKLVYNGDAYVVLQTKVQANPLTVPKVSMVIQPQHHILAANWPLVVPMRLRISNIKLRGIVVLVVDQKKGVTLVFKNDALEKVDVNSTFDNIPNIRRFLQNQIESQLRKMFQDDLPQVVHNLSLLLLKKEDEAKERAGISLGARGGNGDWKGGNEVASSPPRNGEDHLDGSSVASIDSGYNSDHRSHRDKWAGNLPINGEEDEDGLNGYVLYRSLGALTGNGAHDAGLRRLDSVVGVRARAISRENLALGDPNAHSPYPLSPGSYNSDSAASLSSWTSSMPSERTVRLPNKWKSPTRNHEPIVVRAHGPSHFDPNRIGLRTVDKRNARSQRMVEPGPARYLYDVNDPLYGGDFEDFGHSPADHDIRGRQKSNQTDGVVLHPTDNAVAAHLANLMRLNLTIWPHTQDLEHCLLRTQPVRSALGNSNVGGSTTSLQGGQRRGGRGKVRRIDLPAGVVVPAGMLSPSIASPRTAPSTAGSRYSSGYGGRASRNGGSNKSVTSAGSAWSGRSNRSARSDLSGKGGRAPSVCSTGSAPPDVVLPPPSVSPAPPPPVSPAPPPPPPSEHGSVGSGTGSVGSGRQKKEKIPWEPKTPGLSLAEIGAAAAARAAQNILKAGEVLATPKEADEGEEYISKDVVDGLTR
ncbi:ERMES complex subunit [Borealophlyctis nickersoniae]|nr:ERMES complex subunit [Borealophlyctis nickersoniae]